MKNKPMVSTLWLVRHALAVEADVFAGADGERPLVDPGRVVARRFFKHLSLRYPKPDVVVSSEAVRAVETAELFCAAFGVSSFQRTARLNPGCRFKDIRRVIRSAGPDTGFMVLVGHEPDFSDAVGRLVSDGLLAMKLKKCGLVELKLNADRTFRLSMLLTPEVLLGDKCG